ncbi:NAD(P)H-binding protein [Pseudanabaenaceae cyanobacterium LEGE 13415]|nr:NAD(P)H-binding protein [Pseudanabaenaceae cyanobacterium LEGE 13415]
MSVLIVGATGTLGRQITRRALDEGYKVRCLVRSPRRAAFLKEWGAELVTGNICYPETLAAAFEGVTAVIDAATARATDSLSIRQVDWTGKVNLIQAAKAAGVDRYIFFSILDAEKFPNVPLMEIKTCTEKFLAESGLNYTILRPCGFLQGLIGQYAIPILEGQGVWVMGNTAPTAYMDTIDIAKFSEFYLRLFQRQCWICPDSVILPPLYRAEFQVIVCPIQGETGTIGEFGLVLPDYPRWSGFQADAIAQLVSQAIRAYQSAQQIQSFRTEVAELQHLKTLQNDFIEALSHELRTPLTNMRMAIELMQRIATAIDDPEAPNPQVQRLEQYLKILQQEWHEEFSLVNDLLAFQNASSGSDAMPLNEVRIQDWLAVAIGRFSTQTVISIQLERTSESISKLLVHLPTLDKTIVQLLTHLNHANPDLPIQLRTFVDAQNFCISACCVADTEEVLSRRRQNVSNLRLALLRRYAIDLNAKVTVEQRSGTTVLTLSLPIRTA